MTDTPRPSDTLGLTVEQMRVLAHRVADLVVDHVVEGPSGPVIQVAPRPDLESVLAGPSPEQPGDPEALVETLVDVVFTHMQHGDHPRYFARVPSPSSFIGVIGDWLATGYNAMAASWVGSSGPTVLELTVIDWLAQRLGLAAGTEGILASGGSHANLLGLLVALRTRGDGVVYLTGQTHASIARDLSALGVADEDVRLVETDGQWRMSPASLALAVANDRSAGRRPVLVVATAGATNTGAVDPIGEIAGICRTEGLWLHVDGAYGASAALCERGREVLGPLALADSLVLDPHKWLFQPYDAGCLFVREVGALERTLAMHPEYLADASHPGEVDLKDRTLELSRRARAVKLWLTIKTHGFARIAEAITAGIEMAETAERLIRDDEDWEVVTPAQLGVVTFARRGQSAEAHWAASAALTRGGYAAATCTVLSERAVLRLCTINPRTTVDDVAGTLARLAATFGPN